MEPQIIHKLQSMGMPANLLGYEYLKTALPMCIEHPEMVRTVTTKLYPAVAQIHNSAPQRIERTIRSAIEAVWKRCDKENLIAIFGPAIGGSTKCPTNAEFLAIVAEQLRLEESHNG